MASPSDLLSQLLAAHGKANPVALPTSTSSIPLMNLPAPIALSAPHMGSLTPPQTGTGGAVPQGLASLFGLSGAAPANQMPTSLPLSGKVPPMPTLPPPRSPAMSPAPGKTGGLSPPPIGVNTFGVHPTMTQHDIMDYLLPRIANVESVNSGGYKADASKNILYGGNTTAAGKYQYTDSTWNNYKGYKRALDAPPEVQEERMINDLSRNLTRFGNDPFKALVEHYYPAHREHPEKWNDKLVDKHGKELAHRQTIQEYLSSILPKEKVAAYIANQQLARKQAAGQ